MSTPYVGEIRMFAGSFPPQGWMFCEGQALPIAENDVLFTLIGTTYGGDGQTTFNLPDLRGRIPLHQGTGAGLSTRVLGEASGAETVTVAPAQMPMHNHLPLAASGVGHLSEPGGAVPAADRDFPVYDSAPAAPMAAGAVQAAGGGQPHENMPPFLCVSFIISLFGIFPPQN